MHLDDSNLVGYLADAGLLEDARDALVEAAGDGNINWVRRVIVPGASPPSFIVKQARPALERFPEYEVSTERIVFEHRYGEVARERIAARAGILPDVLHFDALERVLVMEDLGSEAPRLDAELSAGRADASSQSDLGEFLASMHAATRADAEALARDFQNTDMRSLHGEHIFTLPYQDNDFPIEEELREHADRVLDRAGVREAIAELRADYYGRADALVHGDVQAGNVLLQGSRPRLLDAEIAHVGDPAFDLGTALAHLHFQVVLQADSAPFERAEAALLDGYSRVAGDDPDLRARAWRHAGVELLRRSIGAARLDIVKSAAAAARTVSRGAQLVLA